MKRLMLLTTRSPEQPLQLAEFDKQVALEASLSRADCNSFLVRCLRRSTPTHSSTIKRQSQKL
ncbi:hypothetical protein [Nostoc sp. LPT]|uniref:hypothetical protein n=1 Tax=Nostoc sp. LPT TaxID=2815387 RepID=UPI001E141D3C|nr:hypothetical protein [Nostoc sp. LPT]MBN4004016.1 hypothetical protein [Nostoc sp. LPT]